MNRIAWIMERMHTLERRIVEHFERAGHHFRVANTSRLYAHTPYSKGLQSRRICQPSRVVQAQRDLENDVYNFIRSVIDMYSLSECASCLSRERVQSPDRTRLRPQDTIATTQCSPQMQQMHPGKFHQATNSTTAQAGIARTFNRIGDRCRRSLPQNNIAAVVPKASTVERPST